MKNNIIFAVFVLVVVGLLFALSGQRAPRLPQDASHAVTSEVRPCLDCHGPAGQFARKATHPPKDQCMECHRVKRKTAK